MSAGYGNQPAESRFRHPFRKFVQPAVARHFPNLRPHRSIFPNGMVCLICIDLSAYLPMREENEMTPKDIGQIVRAERKAQGLRQDQIAATVGVWFLAELEAGKPTAQIGKALAVLDTLGCRLAISAPHEPSGTSP